MGITGTRKLLASAIATAALSSALFAGGAQAAHFLNPDNMIVGGGVKAAPYPSPIAVAGLTGNVSKVTATISGLENELDDVQILLVGPGGQTTVLWRAICQNALNFNGAAYNFDDAGSSLPAMNCPGSGIYKPTDLDQSPTPFTPPAPQGQPYGSTLSVFNGTNPNGTWNLFVESTQAGGSGAINGGWTLDIDTVQPPTPATSTPPPATSTATPGTQTRKCKKKKRSAQSAKKKCKRKRRK
jgi:hypothetical protein